MKTWISNHLLILALVSSAVQSPYIHAQPGNHNQPSAFVLPTDGELKDLVQRKHTDATNAPNWVKALWSKKVGSYFPKGEVRQDQLNQLLNDATNLHTHYEQDNRGKEYSGFVQGHLKPFIFSLTPKKLFSSLRGGLVTRPIAEWTVETLVVIKQITALTKFSDFATRTLNLVSGPHLKGASIMAIKIAVAAAVAVTLYKVGAGVFIAGMAIGAIQAGPLAAIINSATSWFLNPTTEFIRVLNARFTGGWEQKINNYFDRWKPEVATEEQVDKTNDRPRIADIKKDGMNFANMTPEDQVQNWDQSLERWVAVAKRFGQLLRDTHHQGRVLMMVSWSDEQNSTQLVETMDVKLVNLNMEVEILMNPYKTALLMKNEVKQKDELVGLFDEFQNLCESTWMTFEMKEEEVIKITDKIESVQKQLTDRGVSTRDLLRLNQIQADRAKAVGTIVTALTVNEIRSFSVAEANRNLEVGARNAQREVRKGYHLQSYVDKYLPMVQEQMRRMGYVNSGVRPDQKPCVQYLAPQVFPVIPKR